MNVSRTVKDEKAAFVREMFVKDNSTRASLVQNELKLKFGRGMAKGTITAIRRSVAASRSQGAAATAQGIKAAGVRTRVKSQETSAPTATDVVLQRQIEDLAQIIRKRIPGIRKFILLIGEDGKPTVEYSVVASLEGKVQL